MKRISLVGVTLCAAFLLAHAPAAQAAQGCSDASISGDYGFTMTGTRIGGDNPGPRADVGAFTADGHGGLAGSATKSATGIISRNVAFTGNYTVNADCTGSLTVAFTDGDNRSADLVVVKQHEVRWIQTDSGRVSTGIARRRAD